MCGPVAASGGVSVHTKFLVKSLSDLGNNIIFFNLYEKKSFLSSSVSKIYQRTFGIIITAIKKRNEYEIIHVQTSGGIASFVSSITGCLIAKILHKASIITFHHSNTELFVRKYKKLFRIMLKHTNKLILVSDGQRNIVADLFPNFSDKLVVIPNGYNSKLFYPRSENECRDLLGLPFEKKIIIEISNLIESKGHKYLIDAMNILSQERDDILCYIIGTGPLKEDITSYIKKLKLENYIKLIGWRPDEELPIWINSCDIFVHPSLAESFGIVQIEAMACGKPVVSTYNGGSESVIVSQEYGLLCEPANSQELVNNILKVFDTQYNMRKIVNYAKKYSWEKIAVETENVYKKIL